jgi:hypothetical protein
MTWDYLVIEEKLDQATLSELGRQGWKLVAVVSPAHAVLHYFFTRAVAA